MDHKPSPSFAFECWWSEPDFHKFMQRYVHYCWLFSALYVVTIYSLKKCMESRPRFALRLPMILWSASLALFSIAGAVRTWMGMIDLYRNAGLYATVCTNPDHIYYCNLSLWGGLFTLSKVYELGDTLFIVLKKQPLIFLHWYHHITVLIYNWYSYAEHAAPGKAFYTMNYTVHAFMYSYYAMTAMKYRPPTVLKKFITALQLSQMAVGCSLNAYSYYLKTHGTFCEQSYDNLLYSSLMYFSYLVLFAKFYRDAYLQPKRAPIKKEDLTVCSNGLNSVSSKATNGHVTNGHVTNRHATNGHALKSNEEKASYSGNGLSNGMVLRSNGECMNGNEHMASKKLN